MKELKFYGDLLVEGKDSINYLKNLDSNKVFIVTGGNSMKKNGTIDKIEKILNEKSIEFYLFSGVKKNPDTEVVLQGIEKMKKFKPDTVIGVGGGSSIDAAKVMTVFYEYPHISFQDALKGLIPEKRKIVKFIAIPATSGTATEVTKAAVITFKEQNIKIGLKSRAFIPDIAILDPAITLSMPDNVVAETGLDALTHAVECYINNNLDDFTECLAKGAIEGLFKYLPQSYKNKDSKSREKVHNYQCMAGFAFQNVGLGMDHGISHAFGGKYDLGHGLLNGTALPYVLQFNSKDKVVEEKLKYLARVIGCDDFINAVKDLNSKLSIPSSFKELGIDEQTFERDFDELVKNSLKGSTTGNPIPIVKEDMEKILRCIYEGRDIEYEK